ncbi:hypothetical protein COU13_01085 [Candidatus Kaiserbacteria bacterium CG10_big_fil_rev_8_21_14_0_10_43_70]|uniref:HAD family phosphatase n=1 Tax=Candidatus Kaiserbacteria bacterium CG10_big_fil_rev_8_21_14_0_10_43_70 TaxID=1974605 RepID=A0A2H0UJ25_9BACT|nr:MAG: hypothetical protein COU13_01085 [Candidatus Kaiserbacteria bacterium CG10_big_fil_rev_8_21_14_0_10_43_70]
MIVKRAGRFHDRYAEEFNIQPGKLAGFFSHEFQDCIVGKRDLKYELQSRISKWGWKKSVDELLKYWFEGEQEINTAMLNRVKGMREKGCVCYLTTNNEKYRTEYLFNTLGLKKYFDDSFSTCYIGFKKSEEAFWKALHARIGSPDKSTVMVWDDDEANIQAAREAGLTAFTFKNEEDFEEQMSLCI